MVPALKPIEPALPLATEADGGLELLALEAGRSPQGILVTLQAKNGSVRACRPVALVDPADRERYAAEVYPRGAARARKKLVALLVESVVEVEAAVREQQRSATRAGELYAVHGGRICRRGASGTWSPLCNFVASIDEEVIRDDGATEQGELRITGRLQSGVPLGTAHVALERFPGMSWPVTAWGTQAVVSAGMGTKDQLREAIQVLSENVVRRRVYAHTGWREIEGAWSFLHAGGAIGPIGAVPGVDVALDKKLARTVLPAPPEGSSLTDAVRASLALIDLAPDTVMAAVLGCTYRAPLSHALPMDASVHLHGGSGNFKTELAALAMAHYGTYDRLSLPGAWASTGNSLELLTFLAKDTVVVIDDFAPTGTAQEIARYHATADRVLRAVGNQAGRARMSADGRLRPQYAPRGVVLSSGEDVPKGHSLAARLLVVDVARGDVSCSELTVAQQRAAQGTYAAAMAGYVRWLSSRFESLCGEIPERFGELRTAAHSDGAHARMASTQAHLMVGWELWLRFATDCGAIRQADAEAVGERVRVALAELAVCTQGQLAAHEPAARFIELLGSVLSAGKAHLVSTEGGVPSSPERWGWQLRAVGDEMTWVPLVPQRIGWLDGDDLYLEPDATYATVQRLAREEGEGVPLAPKTMWKRLAEKGLLASRDADERNLVRRTLSGSRVRVLHIVVSTLEGTMPEKSGQSDQAGQSPSASADGRGTHARVGAHSGPISGPILTAATQNRATESGQEAADAGTDTLVTQESLPNRSGWPDWSDSQDIVAAMGQTDVESF